MTDDFELSDKQKEIRDSVIEWLNDKASFNRSNVNDDNFFVIGGYAGTGKTTTITAIIDEMKKENNILRIRFAAYTGKATLVLAEQGHKAQTLHSLFYKPEQTVDEYGNYIVEFNKLSENEKDMLRKNVDLIIVDEASMVPKDMLDNLREDYRGIDFLFVGDPFQLPPVEGTTHTLFDGLDDKYILKEVHRSGNNIAEFANKIRRMEKIDVSNYRKGSNKNVVIADHKVVSRYMKPRKFSYNRWKIINFFKKHLVRDGEEVFDIVITKNNKARRAVNYAVRQEKGFLSKLPQKGDKVLCFQNNNKIGAEEGHDLPFDPFLANGSIGYVSSEIRDLTSRPNKQLADIIEEKHPEDNKYKTFRMDFKMEFDEDTVEFKNLLVTDKFFLTHHHNKPPISIYKEKVNYFDFGHAITAHKCVSADTWIWVEEGLKKIKDIAPEDMKKGELREFTYPIYNQYGKTETSHIYYGGKEETYKIRTRLGLELECSPNHPIQVMNKEGKKKWVKAPNLKENMRLPIPYGMEINNDLVKSTEIDYAEGRNSASIPEYINKDLAELLGILVADGCYTDDKDYRVGFTKYNKEYLNFVKQRIENLFNITVTIKDDGNLYFHNKKVRTFLLNCGLDYKKAFQKEVPKAILKSPLRVKKAFLRGLFSGDGSVSVDKNNIRYKTSSKVMAKQLQLMLLNIGIITKRSVSKFDNKQHHDSWLIAVYSSELQRYIDEIGFVYKPKQKQLEKVQVGKRKMWGDIPGGSLYCEKLRRELRNEGGNNYPESKLIGRMLGRKACGTRVYDRDINTITNNIVNKTESYKWFEERKEENIFYDEIVSIKKGEAEIYDVTEPKQHEFISNGMISHNSQGSEWDKVLVILEPYGFDNYIYNQRGNYTKKYGFENLNKYNNYLKMRLESNEDLDKIAEDLWKDYVNEKARWFYTSVTRAKENLGIIGDMSKVYGFNKRAGIRDLKETRETLQRRKGWR